MNFRILAFCALVLLTALEPARVWGHGRGGGQDLGRGGPRAVEHRASVLGAGRGFRRGAATEKAQRSPPSLLDSTERAEVRALARTAR